ncbi:MAG: GNAT family N-acetyltransferase [Chloroflexota bacterium]
MLRRIFRRTGSDDTDRSAADADDRQVSIVVRQGEIAELRTHVPANLEAFQRWYADPEIAELLRHDLEPLTPLQSRGYFQSLILPLSARGLCYAIHDRSTGELVGTTAITDITTTRDGGRSGLLRIVIGEKSEWGRGLGTDATKLVMEEAFDEHELDEMRLDVYRHNPRAIATYRRVGFRVTGEHVEWLSRRKQELHVIEMTITSDEFWDRFPDSMPAWETEDSDDSWDSDDDSADDEADRSPSEDYLDPSDPVPDSRDDDDPAMRG